jgi:predicted Rossmann fold flavoprotein
VDYDVIIVGAGAAGLMSGIFAARQRVGERGARVLVLDSQTKIGAKILVAGGGRCNVTNEFVDASRFHTSAQSASIAKSFVARVLRSFSVDQTHRFFDEIGVELKLEETGKYFPVSDKARTVLNALLDALRDAGAELKTGCIVNAIRPPKEETTEAEVRWTVRTADGDFHAPAVIVCTGGLALPKSGSNGAGYEFARRVGHTLVSTTPALSPLIAHPPRHATLSGITLPAMLTLRDGDHKLAQFTGSFLFTHVGYSGPVALNISRHFACHRKERPDAAIYLRLLTEVADSDEGRFWHAFIAQHARKTVFNALREHLPQRVAENSAAEAKVPADATLGKLGPQQSRSLRDTLLDRRLPVTEIGSYTKAEATAGGICLDEIEPATMMSRLANGLFFAGEVCDVDGWLGGYNFQWAWSSGAIAGRSATKYALRQMNRGADEFNN